MVEYFIGKEIDALNETDMEIDSHRMYDVFFVSFVSNSKYGYDMYLLSTHERTSRME